MEEHIAKPMPLGDEIDLECLSSRNRAITLQQAGTVLCCSYSTVLRLVRSGDLKAFRVRGSWRTTTAACSDFIDRKIKEQRLVSQSVEIDDCED